MEVLDDLNPSPLRVALSGIAGSTSLACWIVLLLPQLVEQWRLKSADGLSIQFVTIWFIGDLLNLIGSLWAGLLVETIMLAVWFCITDVLMISSYLYYSKIYPKHHKHKHLHHHETSPLIDPNSRRSSHKSRRTSINSIVLEPKSHSIFVKYILPVLFVIAAGVFGYFMSPASPSAPDSSAPDAKIQVGPQILGYCSATLYLTARLPQIYQNHKNRSCEGLSLLFFIFSVFGNFTYAMQIFLYRSDWQYIKLYLSWIIGSLGTTVEDFTIFSQFYIYRNHENLLDSEAIIDSNNEALSE